MKLLFRGAEAEIYEDGDLIIKKRISKNYRIQEIDKKIIATRIKKETKVLKKLNLLKINTPKFFKTEGNSIFMERIEGITLKEALNESNYPQIMHDLGVIVGRIHNENIIHGDLTTLNFLIDKCDRIVIIDFGLSFISAKTEDKSVDLYVFERAVKCAHSEKFIIPFYEGYSSVGSQEVLDRLESVRLRGRKREVIG